MNIFASARFEITSKKHGFIFRLDFNDWAIDLSNSRTNSVRTLSLGPIHLTHINYESMNNAINEMIAEFDMSQLNTEQYMSAELDDINIPKTLN